MKTSLRASVTSEAIPWNVLFRWGCFASLAMTVLAPLAFSVKLTEVVTTGLKRPIGIERAPNEPNRLYVLEQAGRIRVLKNGKLLPNPFLDVSEEIVSGGETGLLGLAFHPKYAENGRYFINYTAERPSFSNVIEERHRGDTTAKVLLLIPKPYRNHNAGQILFGPDGYLYIGTGDGGSGGDPHNNAQNLKSFLGKILRIDVDHSSGAKPYAIPADNPFVKGDGHPEIFAYGIRNPWRFSFDKPTGTLWVGDVGQNRIEEIDLVEKGKNYGWRFMEGTQCFFPSHDCPSKGLEPPIYEYGRKDGYCITGGFVYRGKALPQLVGKYIYGDYGSGKIWALEWNPKNKKAVKNELLLKKSIPITTFGEEADGEILVLSHNGAIYRMAP